MGHVSRPMSRDQSSDHYFSSNIHKFLNFVPFTSSVPRVPYILIFYLYMNKNSLFLFQASELVKIF